MIFKKLEKYLKNIDGKIAIYGIGKETEKNIPEINEYVEIVGLLDGFRDNGNIYGYNIISLNKAIKIGIKAIIVIARPGSCRAIVTRIKDKCNENNIKIYDVYGNNLLEEKQSKCTLGKLKPYYKKDLMNKKCLYSYEWLKHKKKIYLNEVIKAPNTSIKEKIRIFIWCITPGLTIMLGNIKKLMNKRRRKNENI